MAKNSVADWDTTRANNTDIGGIDISGTTGKVKDGNDAMQYIMAQIKAGVPYLSGTAYQFSSTAAGAIATLTSTEAGVNAGPLIDLFRDSATPSAADGIGGIRFYGRDSGAGQELYATFIASIADPTAASEDGALALAVMMGGAITTYMRWGANAGGTATANAVGLSLGQLSFPATQNASSDANTLDDYEEGTWTPGPLFNGSATGVTGTFIGVYNTTGNSVEIGANLTHTSNGTGVGAATISALPFTSSGGTGMPFAFDTISGFSGLTAGVCGSNSSGTSTIALRGPSTTGGATLTDTNVTDSATYRIGGNYFKA